MPIMAVSSDAPNTNALEVKSRAGWTKQARGTKCTPFSSSHLVSYRLGTRSPWLALSVQTEASCVVLDSEITLKLRNSGSPCLATRRPRTCLAWSVLLRVDGTASLISLSSLAV